jgi:hypothetical protein
MEISTDTLLVVSLMMAVFAAITTLGSSLILGVGFERLRNGVEILKKQTGFFSDSLHRLDQRTESLEKQGTYFFQTVHALEQKMAEAPRAEAQPQIKAEPAQEAPALISASTGDVLRTQADSLLTTPGFTEEAKAPAKTEKGESIFIFH